MARSKFMPVPPRARPEPGRTKPDSGRPPVEVGRKAGDGPPTQVVSGRANEVPGRAICAVELSSRSSSPSPSSSSSPSSIQFLFVRARHLIHHTCWSSALRDKSSVATSMAPSNLRRRSRDSARCTGSRPSNGHLRPVQSNPRQGGKARIPKKAARKAHQDMPAARVAKETHESAFHLSDVGSWCATSCRAPCYSP